MMGAPAAFVLQIRIVIIEAAAWAEGIVITRCPEHLLAVLLVPGDLLAVLLLARAHVAFRKWSWVFSQRSANPMRRLVLWRHMRRQA